MWVTKQLLVHLIVYKNTMELTGDQQLFGFHILQNSMYVQQKKETHLRFKTNFEWVNDGINIKHYDRIDRQMTEFIL